MLRKKHYIVFGLLLVALGAFILDFSEDSLSGKERRILAAREAVLEESVWRERIREMGGKGAYEEFSREVWDAEPSEQHIRAHSFGAALYSVEGISGLAACDERFGYGCFHEFLGRAIAANGLSVVFELSEKCEQAHITSPLACQHGLGHGIVAYLGYGLENLLVSLAECDKIPDHDPIGGCSGGAFMEYNFQTMLGEEGSLRRGFSENPFSPCDTLDRRHRESCAFWQPQWWLRNLIEMDGGGEIGKRENEVMFAKIGALCADNSLRDVSRHCFEGIGNITLPSAQFDVERSIAFCEAASSNQLHQLFCKALAANSLTVGGSGIKGDGIAICHGLSGDARMYCEGYAEEGGSTVQHLLESIGQL